MRANRNSPQSRLARASLGSFANISLVMAELVRATSGLLGSYVQTESFSGLAGMNVVGTNRTWRDVRLESAFGGLTDVICSQRIFRLLTRSGHSAPIQR